MLLTTLSFRHNNLGIELGGDPNAYRMNLTALITKNMNLVLSHR